MDYSVPVTHRQEVISVCISYFAYFIIARAFIKTSATYRIYLFLQVHSMATYENSLVSGGEDLSIRVWNLDSHTEENCIFVSINFLNKIH